MLFSATKRFEFEMAHTLKDSYSEACQRIHGHSYILDVTLTSNKLNEAGMVIDFKKVKDIIGDYVKSWDHIFVHNYNGINDNLNIGMKYISYNPTAERMVRDIFDNITKLLSVVDQTNKVIVSKVRLQETRTGWAEYFLTEKEIEEKLNKDEESDEPIGKCHNDDTYCQFYASGACYDKENLPCRYREYYGKDPFKEIM